MKCYTEIESKFFLPVNDKKEINHNLDHSKLPKWFYEKYQDLIDLIPKVKEMFSKFSFDKYYNSQNYSQQDKDYFKWLLQKYKTEYLNVSSHLNEELTLLEVKNSIQCWGNILDLMCTIDNNLFEKEQFLIWMQLYNSALIDIGEIDGSLAKRYLPDRWLLTSKGYLYNMQTTAHEAGFFYTYYEEKVEWFLTKRKPYIRNNNPTPGKIDLSSETDPSIILKRGYIKWDPLDSSLHYIDYYHFNRKIYDPKLIMVAIGMFGLREDLFDFFEKLELYTDSPKDNLRKVIKITNNKYLDILIRCCGVSKFTSSPHKTIVTSLLTAKNDFREYLEKGYNVCFIPPIIINKETRMAEELNMDSPIVSKYIENEVLFKNEFSGGKVYTNYI